MKELCTVIFLAANSWLDIKKREISLILTVAYAGCGILCSILQGREIQDVLIPVGIGVLFLASGFASRGAIGVGDGCILLALGTLLDTDWSGKKRKRDQSNLYGRYDLRIWRIQVETYSRRQFQGHPPGKMDQKGQGSF